MLTNINQKILPLREASEQNGKKAEKTAGRYKAE